MEDKKNLNVNGYEFEEPKIEQEFYYTTDHPHQWSSGPTYHYWNKNGSLISSIEEAKEMAEAAYVGGHGDNHCSTTYGVKIACKVKEKKGY